MSSRTYVAQRLGAFAGLVRATDLAGYRMEPLPPTSVRDEYYDTPDGALLQQGICLRLREQDGEQRALLRPIRDDDAGPYEEAEVSHRLGGPFEPEPGPLRDALAALVGSPQPGGVDPLAPLLRLRQYRTPRVAYDGGRLVGVLSFDVVVLELPDGPHASNELTIELADSGLDLDLGTLDPFLRAEGLDTADLSAFERGVAQLPCLLTEPLLLLPHEREVLEALAESENPLHRRRATVLLLDARGFRSATIAGQVGLSTARVRHWKQLFREQRMRVFYGPKAVPLAERPPYRVSEIVADAPDGPYAAQEAPTPEATTAKGPAQEGSRQVGPREGSAPTAAPSEAPLERAPETSAESWTQHARSSQAEAARPHGDTGHDTGDGAPDPPLPLAQRFRSADADIEDLLDLFQPAPTDTPILTDNDEADDAEALSDEGDLAFLAGTSGAQPPEAEAEPPEAEPEASPVQESSPAPSLPAFEPVAVSLRNDTARDADVEPEALAAPAQEAPAEEQPAEEQPALEDRVDEAVADPSESESESEPEAEPATASEVEPEAEAEPEAEPAAPEASGALTSLPADKPGARPRLQPDDGLAKAAHDVIAYHVGQLSWCAAELGRPHGLYRLYLAVHRVRLSLEVFGPVLPPLTVAWLHRGLRPLADAVDESLSRRRQLDPGAAGDPATASVQDVLRGVEFADWAGRMQRLTEGLAVQVQAGTLTPGGGAPPWDDYARSAAALPARSRVRHLLGTALWTRVEGTLAWSPGGEPPGPEHAYRLALACSGLRFVLGLAETAAPGPVREADATLDLAEAALLGLWRERAHTPPEDQAATMTRVWSTLRSDAFRHSLAGVLAAL